MRCLPAFAVLFLAACQSAPEPAAPLSVPALPGVAEILAEVREAGSHGVELVVIPLVDPQVADLRGEAEKAERAGRWRRAAKHLDEALGLVADDPDLLQWRAEVALMLGDSSAAERAARRSASLGPRVGPLCRRNWTLLYRLAEARGEAVNMQSAKAMQEACTVAPPVRM